VRYSASLVTWYKLTSSVGRKPVPYIADSRTSTGGEDELETASDEPVDRRICTRPAPRVRPHPSGTRNGP